MGKYNKSVAGERLRYGSPKLSRYAGQKFCLRVTLGENHLETCFFVYLDEGLEQMEIGKLFETGFRNPTPERIQEIEHLLDTGTDSDLPTKYRLLRKLFEKVDQNRCTVRFHINHGPSNFNLEDTIATHLGTSVWDNGEHDDKILDIVLDFAQASSSQPTPEKVNWNELSGSVLSRRELMEGYGELVMVGIFAVMFIGIRSCSDTETNAGGGFAGGAL